MNFFSRNPIDPPLPITPPMMATSDPSALLGSLAELGPGRIICNQGALSLAISTDFRTMHPRGHHLIFSGGVLELVPENFQILVSTASCGLGLGISLLDSQKNLQMVFHFCHGSLWGKWLENHSQSGLLQPHDEPNLAPINLCWCELWPQTQTGVFPMPGSLLEKRITTLTTSRTIEATLHSTHLELTAVVHPASFDTLASSVRFWDRPRTRVCYADLSLLDPAEHESYVALHA